MPATRRQGRRELRGTVIILVLATIAAGIFFLDRLGALFHRTYTVVAVFPSAPGLRSGNPVWVAGIQSGTIRRIQLLPPGQGTARVAVDLELKRSVAVQVRRDTRVRCASVRLIGEKVVELLPGTPGAPRLADGDTLQGAVPPAADSVMIKARAARLALDSLMTEARPLRKHLAERMTRMRALSRQTALARAELAELQAGLDNGSLRHLMRLQARGGPLDRLQRRTAEVQRLLGRTRTNLSDARRRLAPGQQSLMTHARQLQAELHELQRLMSQPVGTVGRMQKDSALQKAMAGARSQLDSLLVDARKHPWRFVF